MYKIIPKDESEPLRWRICDTMGLQPHRENDCANILKAIDGHVPDRFKFSEEQINQGTPSYIAHSPTKRQSSLCCYSDQCPGA
ncbi:interferon-induced protein 44-like [Actinia tenebrosa]|uniref:Interferon-induced protein 44-like n=1 Tax=Actinia tenebrosa TaxID=6105 RepID=A0A6P8HSR1_ACTTE|nr:interferon-induced protein 44-like [Actinia tenebrosa]